MCAAFARSAAALPVAALLAAAPVSAQDTVVVGGPDAGGNDNVSVNLDALNDGGRNRDRQGVSRGGRTGTGGTGREGQRRFDLRGGDVAEQARRVEPGEVVRGPGGARLQFPLLAPPKSRLTVDMAEFAPKRPDSTPSEQRDERTGDAPVASADGAGSGEPRELDVAQRQSETGEGETGTAATFDAGQRDTGGQQASATERTAEMASGTGDATAMTDSAGTDATEAGADATASDPTGSGTAETETVASGAGGGDGGETGTTEPDSAGTGTTEPTATASAETGTAEADAGGSASGDAASGGGEDPVALQPSGSKPSEELDTQPANTGTESGGGNDTAATGAGDGGSAGGSQDAAGETQTAARTAETGSGDRTMLRFGGDSAELSDAAKGKLDAVVERLKSSDSARIELTAYAKAPGGSASRSRRLSLSRALAVRSYLIEKGVRSTRIDVRALGDAAESEPVDRVDIAPASSS